MHYQMVESCEVDGFCLLCCWYDNVRWPADAVLSQASCYGYIGYGPMQSKVQSVPVLLERPQKTKLVHHGRVGF
jgi:hypothetical protein